MVQSQLLRFTFLFAVVTANKTELSSALGCWPGSCWKALILNQPFSWYYTYVFGHSPWKPVTRYRGKAVKVTRNHMYKGTPWLLWRRPLTLMSSKQQGISVLQSVSSVLEAQVHKFPRRSKSHTKTIQWMNRHLRNNYQIFMNYYYKELEQEGR